MKTFLPFLLIALAGCQAAPSPTPTPAPLARPPTMAVATPTPSDPGLERKIRQQGQYIEALLSQNDALVSRLKSNSESEPYPSPVARALAKPLGAAAKAPVPALAPGAEDTPALVPNADGVIDIAAAEASQKLEETVNPFAVRIVPPEAVREITLQVGGIVAGPVACAVINDKLLQPGDSIESLTVERIEADAVILRHGPRRMRLPLDGKNLRLRLPI